MSTYRSLGVRIKAGARGRSSQSLDQRSNRKKGTSTAQLVHDGFPLKAESSVAATGIARPIATTDQSAAYERTKRLLDLSVAFGLLVLTAPIMVLTAVVVKLSDFGPILYVQTRTGKRGREFSCYKFRSMIVDADRLKADLLAKNRHADQRTFKLEDDPRVTRLGRIFRKLSIDELPQLWNVLRGDMSMVGPRPPVPEEVSLYTDLDRRRLEVRPGLTCIWQVSGRSALPYADQYRMDIEYVENRGLWMDLKILARTVRAVLSCRGAW